MTDRTHQIHRLLTTEAVASRLEAIHLETRSFKKQILERRSYSKRIKGLIEMADLWVRSVTEVFQHELDRHAGIPRLSAIEGLQEARTRLVALQESGKPLAVQAADQLIPLIESLLDDLYPRTLQPLGHGSPQTNRLRISGQWEAILLHVMQFVTFHDLCQAADRGDVHAVKKALTPESGDWIIHPHSIDQWAALLQGELEMVWIKSDFDTDRFEAVLRELTVSC